MEVGQKCDKTQTRFDFYSTSIQLFLTLSTVADLFTETD